MYEAEGVEALRSEIAKTNPEWGVIDNGYAPRNAFNPSLLETFKSSMTKLIDTMLNTRRGIEFNPDTDIHIFQKIQTYHNQLLLAQRLTPHVRHYSRLWERNAYAFEDNKKMKKRLTSALNEMKGFVDEGGPGARLVRRGLKQVMSSIFLSPKRWFRNKHQNAALFPWRQSLRDPRNIPLNDIERERFDARVSQKFGILQHYTLGGGKEHPLYW